MVESVMWIANVVMVLHSERCLYGALNDKVCLCERSKWWMCVLNDWAI